MSTYVTPRHRVYFDHAACGNAIECLKCVHVCRDHGANCIGFVNEKTPPVGENAPKRLEDIKHIVFGVRMYRCDGCGKCVEVCPRNAVRLEKVDVPVPRAVVYQPPFEIRCSIFKDGSMPPEAEKIYNGILEAMKQAGANKG
ncbi:4Fe-4S dicluster domain-containing protein [Moorella sulfitireducens]|uniref:4Fe-4S dicluster domain-containing protein n=1 Tax=Neomoorella sulfitireducens TaxID=2972948 RepID=UPI0021ABFE8B|nr:4Fe-4S binding protein [Moorella sulfitireducens]